MNTTEPDANVTKTLLSEAMDPLLQTPINISIEGQNVRLSFTEHIVLGENGDIFIILYY